MMRWTFLPLIFLVLLPLNSIQTQPAKPLAQIQIESDFPTAYDLAWSPDEEILAVSAGGELIFYNSTLDEVLYRWVIKSGALSASWSPDGTQIAVVSGFRNHDIRIGSWDEVEKAIISEKVLKGASDQDQYLVSWSPDGKRIATLADDRAVEIQFWDMETEKATTSVELPYGNPLRSLIWNADSTTLTGAGVVENTEDIGLFSLNIDGSDVSQSLSLPQTVSVFNMSPDQSLLVTATQEGLVSISRIDDQQTLFEFQSVPEPTAAVWNPSGDKLAVLGYHGELEIWDTKLLLSDNSAQ